MAYADSRNVLWACPLCGKDNPLQAIAVDSEEAAKMCLLCEREFVCLDCQKKTMHPEVWTNGLRR